MQSLKKILTVDSNKKARKFFWAQIGVKLTHFGIRGVFFKNWAASFNLKHNGVMQSMQSFKKILMVNPVKSCLQA